MIPFLIGLNVGYGFCMLLVSHFGKKREAASAEILKAHFVAGLNAGTRNHAIWIHNNIGNDINGFALSCDKCGTIFSALTVASAEYCTCPSCQHRNPAPLGIESLNLK